MRRAVILIAVAVALARPAAALDARVRDVRAAGGQVTAAVELTGVVPGSLQQVLADGGAVHLRLQAELWESRPVWDRLVYPALVRVFRISRNGTPPALTVVEPSGAVTPIADPRGLYGTTLQLGRAERVVPSSRYYVHLVATVGTIAERDIDDVSDAVFGRQSDTGSATALGRFVLRSMLQLSDYLKSETSDIKGRRVSGAEILHH